MDTKETCIEFAESSAREAIDQAPAFGGLKNSIASYRQNVRDTVPAEFECDALSAFDTTVKQKTRGYASASELKALMQDGDQLAAQALVARLEEENAKLLAALKNIARSDEFNGGTFVKELQQIAREAIAEVEGL